MAAAVEYRRFEVLAARSDLQRSRCDICHAAIGVQFADYYWACDKCSTQVFHQLDVEWWRVSISRGEKRK